MNLTKILTKWIPHELTEDQQQFRIDACNNNLLRYRRHPHLLKRTLAIDETWVSLYTAPKGEKRKVWIAKGEEPPTVIRGDIHGHKRMLIMAMDFDGIAFWELLGDKQFLKAETYRQFLERNIPKWLCRNSHKKALIVHENGHPHKSPTVTQWLEENEKEEWGHPAYSPDLQSCDFNCFGPLKLHLSGNKYTNWDNLEQPIRLICRDGTIDGYLGILP